MITIVKKKKMYHDNHQKRFIAILLVVTKVSNPLIWIQVHAETWVGCVQMTRQLKKLILPWTETQTACHSMHIPLPCTFCGQIPLISIGICMFGSFAGGWKNSLYKYRISSIRTLFGLKVASMWAVLHISLHNGEWTVFSHKYLPKIWSLKVTNSLLRFKITKRYVENRVAL